MSSAYRGRPTVDWPCRSTIAELLKRSGLTEDDVLEQFVLTFPMVSYEVVALRIVLEP